MEKYGNFEVNLFHGVPEINISIFEVKSKGFSIPINLSYHASGIKVSDVASWVGLGWSINSGGQISRSVKSREDVSGILNPNNQIKTPEQVDPRTLLGYSYLRSILAVGGPDSEPDVFSYSMPGKYGNFLYKNATTPVLIPSEPIQILRDQLPQSGPFFRFNLLDQQGNNYLFGKSLSGESVLETSFSQVGGTDDSYVSSWLLTHMISADKSDTVSYSYYPNQNVTTFRETNDNVYVRDNFNIVTSGLSSAQATVDNSSITSEYSVSQRLMKEILFDNGKIEFALFANNRNDITAPALDKIRIYSKTKNAFELLKTVQFYYSYFGNSPSLKLRLDSIRVNSADSQLNQTYRFAYDNTSYFDENNPKAKDYWGYFNGRPNTTLVPRTIIPYIAGGGVPTSRNRRGRQTA